MTGNDLEQARDRGFPPQQLRLLPVSTPGLSHSQGWKHGRPMGQSSNPSLDSPAEEHAAVANPWLPGALQKVRCRPSSELWGGHNQGTLSPGWVPSYHPTVHSPIQALRILRGLVPTPDTSEAANNTERRPLGEGRGHSRPTPAPWKLRHRTRK